MKLIAFKNKYKEPGDKKPDFNVFLSREPGSNEEMKKVGAVWKGKGRGGEYLSITIDMPEDTDVPF